MVSIHTSESSSQESSSPLAHQQQAGEHGSVLQRHVEASGVHSCQLARNLVLNVRTCMQPAARHALWTSKRPVGSS